MTGPEAGDVARSHFAEWTRVCEEQIATPSLCVAGGHGLHAGVTYVLFPAGTDRDDLIRTLRYAIASLEAGTEFTL